MKLHVDATKCQGYGLCHEQAPNDVELDEWGYAAVTGDVTDERAARAATEACPVAALRLAP